MSSQAAVKLPLEIEDIKAILPHRYPFLLVDRIVEFETDQRIVGIKKRVGQRALLHRRPWWRTDPAGDDPHGGHGQIGAVLVLAKPENRSRLIYFMGIDRVRYRRPVLAGRLLGAGGQCPTPAPQDGHAQGRGAGQRADRRRRPHDLRSGRQARGLKLHRRT